MPRVKTGYFSSTHIPLWRIIFQYGELLDKGVDFVNWAQVLTKVIELLDIRRILFSFFLGLVTRVIMPNDFIINSMLVSKTEGAWVWVLFVYSVAWYVVFLFFGWIVKQYNERKRRQKEALELQEKIKKEAHELQEKIKREEEEHISKYELLPNGCDDILKSFIKNNNKRYALHYTDDRYSIFEKLDWILNLPIDNDDGLIYFMLMPEVYADIKKLYDSGKLFRDTKETKK